MDNIEEYVVYDSPVPYKDLHIYPATMKQYIRFHMYADCFLLDKNSIPDVNIISMTYLDYLFYLQKKSDSHLAQILELKKNNVSKSEYSVALENMPTPYLIYFNEIMKMVLRTDENLSFFREENQSIFVIQGKKYNSDDFEKIKEIIFYQNCIEDIDDTIDKEVRDAMQDANRIRRQLNEHKICSLEDQLICIFVKTGVSFNCLYELTIRKFAKILKRMDHEMHYKIYKSAEISGAVKFKSKIKHWMADLEQKDESENKVDLDVIKSKMSGSI